jgi:phospho-N-acetylmuramoyl-pentapeptide-transferase
MFYHASLALRSSYHMFNMVHYTTFRALAALLTALAFFLLMGPGFMRWSERLFKSYPRNYTPERHKAKNGIPTMGGILILFVVLLTVFLWCNLLKSELWIILICLVGFAGIGFWDDCSKIWYKKGISEGLKFKLQWFVGLIIGCLWFYICHPATTLCPPFFKEMNPDIGYFFIVWVAFILVAVSNAVNLTDGLDGLAIGSLIPNFASFSLILYVAGHAAFASYLCIPFTENAEIAIVGAALVGASLGFLWYNAYPAQVFMGDVGSLSLGAGLGLMALMAKQEFLLVISGGLFVVETLSVIMQIFFYKKWHKRLFRMAPLHHHFELLGWPESTITIRFAIVTFVLCIIALMTLKMR